MSKVLMPATEASSALSQILISEISLERTLQRVAELGCCVCGADVAGAFLLSGGKLRASAATGLAAAELDQHQCQAGHGPAIEALRAREPFLWELSSTEVPATALAKRDKSVPGWHVAGAQWPDLARIARSYGVSSTLAFPVVVHENVVGMLDFYWAQPFHFDGALAEDMQCFAGQAAIVIANSQVYWETRQLSENLNKALRSRATIDHAIGILMARGAPTPEAAFALLVRTSQRQNRKLRDIATEVVQKVSQGWQRDKAGLLHPSPSPPSPAPPSLAGLSPRAWVRPAKRPRGASAGSTRGAGAEMHQGASAGSTRGAGAETHQGASARPADQPYGPGAEPASDVLDLRTASVEGPPRR